MYFLRSCSFRFLPVICNKIFWILVFYNRAGQLQPTGKLRNLSKAALRAAIVHNMDIENGGEWINQKAVI